MNYNSTKLVEFESTFVIPAGETVTYLSLKSTQSRISKNIHFISYYQVFVSFIDESVVEDPQALVSPDTHKLGDSQKPVGDKSVTYRKWSCKVSVKASLE